ncbi:hypothetical protein H6781_00145 [Candidatus Nomurabacteria bacterium]|nr:hypothetical protein [Candidatus Nomurabacteria bacterium]
MRKVFFCVLSKDIIRRNIYDTEFWPEFCRQTKGVVKVLIVPEEDLSVYVKDFQQDGVIVEGYEKVSWKRWSKFVIFLVRNGINSHSTRTYRWRAYSTGNATLVVTLVKEVISQTLGRSSFYKGLIRMLVKRLPTSVALNDLFEKYKPISVFAPSLIDLDFDVPVSVLARRKGIPIVGMVRSWDNLNNHGLLAFYPDKFIVQNEWLKTATSLYQGVGKNNLPKDIVGLPHYDSYKKPSRYIKPREEFFNSLGLDYKKKLILLGGSDFYYSEDSLPKKLNVAIDSGVIKENVQVVFRPHPRSLFSIDDYKLGGMKNVILDDAFSGDSLFTDAEKFINLLYYSDIIVNISSTLSIDAAVFDKPAICINFDDESKRLSKNQQVHRLYDSFDHYERLVATGGVRTPGSFDKFICDINEYLDDSSLDREGRQEIIKLFVSPFDGVSGVRLASIVRQHLDSVV